MLRITNDKVPVIFSDIDGTFYDSNFQINSDTLVDIDFAIKNGALFNICTGNPCFSKMKNLASKLNCSYLVCSEGSQIFDLVNNKTIFEALIDNETLQKVIEIATQNDLYPFFWNGEKYFYLKDNPNNEILYGYHFDSKEEFKIPQKYDGHEFMPAKIEIYASSQKPSLTLLENLENVEIVQNEKNITILPRGVNKFFAINYLVSRNFIKNVKLNEIMTIGDGNNDVAMLKETNFSYAMANASLLAKQAAKYHTSAVEQNGLGEAILDYLYRLKNIVKKYLFHEFDK
ncbi:COF family HAD hydrolase protein [Metamycoplasma arthritidis]|uniref:COF family HAD hydrolase protein, conserved n=1 Tax=Metamycoplasma arthritidis (strain 158L3-1) TaxID=243272 RepID=B3PMT7_META1|nr:HAD-IIB family hydrolase [Metamycoplasma arthritidis]ACF07339.1 COF family HAD hydrolase protein, conserved [Metamycoplasma arthritidis 158L3-1]VEU78862.1 COF family HAD hydrolase protein [Metamycoplasma arthritidis]